MRHRTGYNPKRRLLPAEETTAEQREALARRARYGGNPEHKRSPGDYGLTPPASPRPGKTLCDSDRPIERREAEELLHAGIRKGLLSERFVGEWPRNVWAVSDRKEAYEAQLENPAQGVYHGYPVPADDAFRRLVEEEWNAR